jgi:hypothetical protein
VIFGRKKKSEIDELMSALLAEPVLELAKLGHDGRLETVDIDFVFALVSHAESAQFHKLASEAIRIGVFEHAMLVANSGGLLQFAVGSLTDQSTKTSDSERFVVALAKVLGTSARIVYGHTSAHVGIVGTEKRKTWGVHPVAMERILRSLLAAVPGEPQRLAAE